MLSAFALCLQSALSRWISCGKEGQVIENKGHREYTERYLPPTGDAVDWRSSFTEYIHSVYKYFNMPSKASAKKPGWVVVASRIPPDLKERIKEQYPEHKLTDVIYSLLDYCSKRKILGLKIQTFQ